TPGRRVLARRTVRPLDPGRAAGDGCALAYPLPHDCLVEPGITVSDWILNTHVYRASGLRHASDSRLTLRSLSWRPQELGPAAGPVPLPVLRCRLARAHDPLRVDRDHRGKHLGDGHRLAGRRRRSLPVGTVRAVAGARTRGTPPAAVDGHSPG